MLLFLYGIRAYRFWKSRKDPPETAIRFVFVNTEPFAGRAGHWIEAEKDRIRVYDACEQLCDLNTGKKKACFSGKNIL